MIGFALLIAPLPVAAAALYADKLDSNSKKDKNTLSRASADDESGITVKSWRWLPAAKQVFVVHLWGAIVSLLPHFISRIPNCAPAISVIVWVLLSMFSLLILYLFLGSSISHACKSQPQEEREWALLKAVTISTTFIGLCLMSVINFATAEIGALLLVPICLMAHPLKLEVRAKSLKAFTRAACNLFLGFLAFPPFAYFLLKGVFEGLDDISVGDLWNWVESLWEWNSATYLYLGMVYLPCWALCIHILFHPC